MCIRRYLYSVAEINPAWEGCWPVPGPPATSGFPIKFRKEAPSQGGVPEVGITGVYPWVSSVFFFSGDSCF